MTRTTTRRSVAAAVTASSSAHEKSHLKARAGKERAIDPPIQTPTPPNADRNSSTTADPNGQNNHPDNHENPGNNPIPGGSGNPPDDPYDGAPDDPDDPDNSDDDNNNTPQDLPRDQESVSAGDAIQLLVNALKSTGKPPKSKVREPNTFDGSTPKKLRTFLAQCRLNFEDRPTSFPSERTKVTYALSYLSGTALQWFEPAILEPLSLSADHFMNDYDLFVDELKLNFGPYDPEADAEAAIENLVMKDTQHIVKYIVEFYRLTAEIHWDDKALCRRFYKNLPARLKNEISRLGKPRTLRGMRDLAQQIDHRHWEREEEIRHETPQRKPPPTHSDNRNNGNNHNGNSTNNSGKKNKPPKSFPSHNQSSSTSNPNSNNRNSGFNKNNNSGSTPQTLTPEYVNKLGKDGKLTPEERERRKANNLCLFCGQSGHLVNSCPKSSSNASKTKARASTLVSNSDTRSSSEK